MVKKSDDFSAGPGLYRIVVHVSQREKMEVVALGFPLPNGTFGWSRNGKIALHPYVPLRLFDGKDIYGTFLEIRNVVSGLVDDE